MSTPTSTLHKFMVYAPDNTEAGTFEKRLSVRPKHAELMKVQQADGLARAAGYLLSPESLVPGAEQKMVGSLLIYEAENIEQVKQKVEEDIYYTSGVWDAKRIVILPFVPAIPMP